MKTKNTMIVVAAVAAVAGSALVAPALAAKKTYAFNMKVTKGVPQVGDKIGATYGGKPFGTCKMTGKLVIPKTIQTWKCKGGGSFILTGTGTSGASNDAKGTWAIKNGSGKGKLKGISGKGTFSGQLSSGKFTYKGKVKY